MTHVEALRFFANGGKLSGLSTIRRLSRSGFITVDDITALDSPDAHVQAFSHDSGSGLASRDPAT
jgi:hypothetical protein